MWNTKIEFIVNLSKLNTIINKYFDSNLWWLWFNDFIVLYNLDNAPDKSLRRIDLAEKVWLSPSWITRLLLPMEKIWLIKKETNNSDARISLVSITKAWKTNLDEAMERMDLHLDEKLNNIKKNKLSDFSDTIKEIWSNFLWR